MSNAAPTTSIPHPQLWEAYRRTRSDADRNALAEAYLPLVQCIAKRFGSRLPAVVTLGDLIQWGMIGLMESIKAFDPGKGAKFATFCGLRVHGAMVDGLRNFAVHSRTAFARTKILLQAEDALTMELGRPPAPEETFTRLKVSKRKYKGMTDTRYLNPRSLDAAPAGTENLSAGGGIVDTRAGEPALAVEARDVLDYAIKNFKLTEAFVLRYIYFEEMSRIQVAEILGLSTTRISGIHNEMLTKLRYLLAA